MSESPCIDVTGLSLQALEKIDNAQLRNALWASLHDDVESIARFQSSI
ncbi:hypothetical protein Pth03_07850 [Planotetraspora thailandica]|uniref:FXSXX-COOH protein n=1 Tax=Planotetraspora thailandica TaxID=487172 RepID=A0A8J3UZN7_9ACTN|nr:hypothetical protein [Planotetraspora thailandica]GII52396.1 hypothetical protein Pth03_07850 [Planotetraspora thailandica]